MPCVDSEAVSAFIVHLHRRGLAHSTIAKRERRLNSLAFHLHPRPLIDATRDDIHAYLDTCAHLAPRSLHVLIGDIASFYRWAHADGIIDADPTANVIRPRVPRYLPRPVTDAQLATILGGAGDPMRCWLTLAAYAGLRTMEIAHLDGADVLLDDAMIRVVGKGRRERILPAHPAVVSELRRCRPPSSGPVFVRPLSGNPWTPHHLGAAMNRHIRDCGVDATAHQLRHWFGSRVHAHCGDLRVTQELLGHSSPETTAIYAAWSRSDARAAVAALAC